MPPDGVKNHRAQRNQKHVADVARRVRQNARENHDDRQKFFRRRHHEQSQTRANQTARFSDRQTEQRDENRSKRRKARKIRDQAGHNPVQALDG